MVTFNSRISNKKDTSENWEANNPILLNGELIIVIEDSGEIRFKVGNGTSHYLELPFVETRLAVRFLSYCAELLLKV